MTQPGERVYDHRLMERVMSCPATQAKLEKIKAILKGRQILKVEFANEIRAIGIVLHLDNGKLVAVSMDELNITMLLRDPDIARQEQDLHYQTHIYQPVNCRRKKKGKNTHET